MESNATDKGLHRFASLDDLGMVSASSAAPPPGASKGFLHVIWEGRIPHFVFTTNDHKEAYITNLTNAGTCSEGSPKYVYFVYSKVHDHRIYTPAPPQLVGEMKVTTSSSVCPHSSKITQMEFVFSAGGDEGKSTSGNERNTELQKKLVDLFMVDLFKNSRFNKRRSKSSFDGMLENPFSESSRVARLSLEKMEQRSMSIFDGVIIADLETLFAEATQVARCSLEENMKQTSMPSFDEGINADLETPFAESSRRSLEKMKQRSMSSNADLETPFAESTGGARRSFEKMKQRSMSCFDGEINADLETLFAESSRRSLEKMNIFDGHLELSSPKTITHQETRPSFDQLGHELSAIVVKEHHPVQTHRRQINTDKGGWGLKFLGKAESRKNTLLPECCSQSRVMDIIIPAGIHGGTDNGNEPSTLLDRWRFGKCDCGGWDISCPLTVLKTRLPPEDYLDNLDLFIQGSKQLNPTFSLKKLSDGLYLVHFQPCLSALQSFSIAVAHIHTQKNFEQEEQICKAA